jgi:hypothetical protein
MIIGFTGGLFRKIAKKKCCPFFATKFEGEESWRLAI